MGEGTTSDMERVPFTRKHARAVRRGREARGATQYELAEELGWPRSKIKRLEKHEVVSIVREDLAALTAALDVGGADGERGAPKIDEVPNAVAIDVGREDTTREIPNVRFFEVVFREETSSAALRGAELRHDGVTYRVHGVEHETANGGVFVPGDQAVLLLWNRPQDHGKPRAKTKTKKTKTKTKTPKADKGRPKPRLDYEEGTARVLKALRRLRQEGNAAPDRGEIQRRTGYTACQARTFCKVLEAQGVLRREGKGRGMRYVLVR